MNQFPVCSTCNGSGLIQNNAFGWTQAYPCPTCGGKGVVLVVVNDAQVAMNDKEKKP